MDRLYTGGTYTGSSATFQSDSFGKTCDYTYYYYSQHGQVFEHINWQYVALKNFNRTSLATLNSLAADCCSDGNSIAKSSFDQTASISVPTNLELTIDSSDLNTDITGLVWTRSNHINWPKIAVADFDADGFDDIVIGTFMDWVGYIYLSGLTVFTNNNIGQFKPGKSSKFDIERRCNIEETIYHNDCKHVILTGDPVISDIQTADIDGDGFLDIIATWPHLPLIAWSRNSGDGSFENLRTISNTTRAYSLVTVDVDYDGSIDVVAGSFGEIQQPNAKIFDKDKPFERISDPFLKYPYIQPRMMGVYENCSALATCNLTCSRVLHERTKMSSLIITVCNEYCKSS